MQMAQPTFCYKCRTTRCTRFLSRRPSDVAGRHQKLPPLACSLRCRLPASAGHRSEPCRGPRGGALLGDLYRATAHAACFVRRPARREMSSRGGRPCAFGRATRGREEIPPATAGATSCHFSTLFPAKDSSGCACPAVAVILAGRRGDRSDALHLARLLGLEDWRCAVRGAS
jgi:hypothetical protein